MTPNGVCESCGEPMRWGFTTTGSRMPLDVAPAPAGEGTVWITPEGRFRVLDKDERARAYAQGVELWETHLYTCAAAERHRSVSRQQLGLGV